MDLSSMHFKNPDATLQRAVICINYNLSVTSIIFSAETVPTCIASGMLEGTTFAISLIRM